jgi:hypothetical protein
MAAIPEPEAGPAPDLVPVLGRGRHRDPARGACFLEYTSLLAGEPFSDEPACVDREFAALGRPPDPAELRGFDGGREPAELFWHLMSPAPRGRRGAEPDYVDRLVARLHRLHACFERELRPAEASAPAPFGLTLRR